MESARVQIIGQRIKAAGRIIGGAGDEHPPFSASYDLVTDEVGATRRLSIRLTVAAGERALSISRDEENTWMVETSTGVSYQRSKFDGALDVDMTLSPLFNALPIRRLGMHKEPRPRTEVPVAYLNLLELTVEGARETYESADDGVKLHSPLGDVLLAVDEEGFVVDYPGLAVRV